MHQNRRFSAQEAIELILDCAMCEVLQIFLGNMVIFYIQNTTMIPYYKNYLPSFANINRWVLLERLGLGMIETANIFIGCMGVFILFILLVILTKSQLLSRVAKNNFSYFLVLLLSGSISKLILMPITAFFNELLHSKDMKDSSYLIFDTKDIFRFALISTIIWVIVLYLTILNILKRTNNDRTPIFTDSTFRFILIVYAVVVCVGSVLLYNVVGILCQHLIYDRKWLSNILAYYGDVFSLGKESFFYQFPQTVIEYLLGWA